MRAVARMVGTRRMRSLGLALAVILGGTAGAVVPLATAAGASGSSPSMTLRATGTQARVPSVVLVARLGGRASSPATQAGVSVTFSVGVDEFAGRPRLLLGSGTTDAAGVARFVYHPTWTGRQDFVASVTNATGTLVAQATTTFVVTAAVPPTLSAEATRPDGTLGRYVVGVLLAILVLLWIVLVTVLVRVHRVAGRQPRQAA